MDKTNRVGTNVFTIERGDSLDAQAGISIQNMIYTKITMIQLGTNQLISGLLTL